MEALPSIPSFISDLLAGIVATLVFGVWAVLTRVFGDRAGGNVLARVRHLGWPLVAAIFFGGALVSAIVRGGTTSIIVLGGLLALAAFIMLLRFGPERLHLHAPGPAQPVVRFIQAYPYRIIAATFFVASVVLFFTDVEGSSSPDLSEQIVFVVGLDDTEMLTMREILDELEPELGAEVFLMNVDPSRQVARLDSMVASGDTKWDLVAVDNNMLGLLAAKGLVEDLSQLTERDDLIPEPLLPSVRPLLDFEDKFYFAPFRVNVRIGYYNEAKFDEFGLTPPRTWTQLQDVATSFKENGGVGRVSIAGFPGPPTSVTVYEFVRAWGGNPRTLDDQGSKDAFTFLKELEPDLASQYVETRFDTANDLLLDDQIYFVSNWTFGIKVVILGGRKTDIKVYSGWSGPADEVHVLGGELLAVPRGAPRADKAIELIRLLQVPETQKKFLGDLFWLPVRVTDATEVPPELEEHFAAINLALARSEARPTIPEWPLIEDCLDHAFQSLVVSAADVAELTRFSSFLRDIASTDYIRHMVEEGDTLETIAMKYGTTNDLLADLNRTSIRASLAEGQLLVVLPGLDQSCSQIAAAIEPDPEADLASTG